MFYPGTTTSKPTWQDPNQTVQNTAPLQLDSNGCAILWGLGSYRQQLWTGPVVGGLPTGNLVFDLTVQDISSQFNWFWAGTATGTVNAIQLADVAWNPTAGQNIQFQPLGLNTGPVTVSPNVGVVPISVLKDTTSGPVGLTGGELGPGDVANIVYDSIGNIFHLQNPLLSTGVSIGVPIGVEVSCAGFAPPTGFLFEYGQAVDRTTYAQLLAQLTSSQIGVLTSASTTVTGLTSTEQLAHGMPIEGANVPGGTTIDVVTSPTTIVMNNPASGNGTNILTFFAYPNGDGSTNFNLPDRRGRVVVGRDNMGGTAAGVLNNLYTTSRPTALAQNLSAPTNSGGSITLSRANLPNVTFPVTIPGGKGSHDHSASSSTSSSSSTPTASFNLAINDTATGFGGGGSAGYSPLPGTALTTTISRPTISSSTSTTVSANTLPAMDGSADSGGSGARLSIVQPGQTSNLCIRVQ